MTVRGGVRMAASEIQVDEKEAKEEVRLQAECLFEVIKEKRTNFALA